MEEIQLSKLKNSVAHKMEEFDEADFFAMQLAIHNVRYLNGKMTEFTFRDTQFLAYGDEQNLYLKEAETGLTMFAPLASLVGRWEVTSTMARYIATALWRMSDETKIPA